MTDYLVVLAHYCSNTNESPSESAVSQAFRSVTAAFTPASEWGGWVAPCARITRDRLSDCPWNVRAAGLWQLPEGLSAESRSVLEGTLKTRLLEALRAATGGEGDRWNYWRPVTTSPYVEALNGPVGDWRAGTMCATRTRDNFDVGNPENSTGPNTVLPPPQTLTGEIGRFVSDNKVPIAIVSGTVGLLVITYLAGPAIRSALKTRAAKKAAEAG